MKESHDRQLFGQFIHTEFTKVIELIQSQLPELNTKLLDELQVKQFVEFVQVVQPAIGLLQSVHWLLESIKYPLAQTVQTVDDEQSSQLGIRLLHNIQLDPTKVIEVTQSHVLVV